MSSSEEDDDDDDLTRAILMSTEPRGKSTEMSRETTNFKRNSSDVVELKQIAADNSCLFNSIGFCMDGRTDAGMEYRNIVAIVIAKNKDGLWTEAVLGKPPHIYVRWIRDPKKWGGEIEMVVLSKHLEVEIAAFSVQTCRMTLYGKGFKKRIYLLYSGIHYDAVMKSSEKGGREGGVFASDDVLVLSAVEDLVQDMHKKHKFVNLAGFKLQCMVCRKELRGQKDAALHAKETGHAQFGEISSTRRE